MRNPVPFGDGTVRTLQVLGATVAVLAAALVAAASATTPPDREAVVEAARRVLASGRFQDVRPDARDPATTEAGPAPDLPEPPPRHRRVPPRPSGVPGSGAVARMILWLLAGGALVVLVGTLMRDGIQRLRSARRRDPTGAASRAMRDEPVAKDPARAEQLAAAGRFADAVRLLLRSTLELLGRRSDPLPPGTTARELMRRIPLGDEERGALGVLVRTVESSWFGGAPVSTEDWQRCRDAARQCLGADGEAA